MDGLVSKGKGAMKLFKSIIKNIVCMKSVRAFHQYKKQWRKLAAFSLSLAISIIATAQDGNAGINEANTKVRSYFAAGTNLMYAVGAIVGLIGAVKVYQKWNSGDHDTGKVAAAWFGSCVFLVIVATVIRSFFGV
jgi:hypothetical protein